MKNKIIIATVVTIFAQGAILNAAGPARRGAPRVETERSGERLSSYERALVAEALKDKSPEEVRRIMELAQSRNFSRIESMIPEGRRTEIDRVKNETDPARREALATTLLHNIERSSPEAFHAMEQRFGTAARSSSVHEGAAGRSAGVGAAGKGANEGLRDAEAAGSLARPTVRHSSPEVVEGKSPAQELLGTVIKSSNVFSDRLRDLSVNQQKGIDPEMARRLGAGVNRLIDVVKEAKDPKVKALGEILTKSILQNGMDLEHIAKVTEMVQAGDATVLAGLTRLHVSHGLSYNEGILQSLHGLKDMPQLDALKEAQEALKAKYKQYTDLMAQGKVTEAEALLSDISRLFQNVAIARLALFEKMSERPELRSRLAEAQQAADKSAEKSDKEIIDMLAKTLMEEDPNLKDKEEAERRARAVLCDCGAIPMTSCPTGGKGGGGNHGKTH